MFLKFISLLIISSGTLNACGLSNNKYNNDVCGKDEVNVPNNKDGTGGNIVINEKQCKKNTTNKKPL